MFSITFDLNNSAFLTVLIFGPKPEIILLES
jgi:hypothetical protein